MKALQELVDYLFSRGMLSSQERVSLAAKGLLVELPPGDSETEELPEDPYESFEDKLIQRGVRRGGQPNRGMRADEINEALLASIESWDAPLEGLRAIGRYLGGDEVSGWREASVLIEQASPYILALYLTQVIPKGTPRFSALWESLSLSAPFDVIGGQSSGFGVVSYRRLLSQSSDDVLKRYGWILRYDAVQSAYNLVKAQNQLWRALKIIFEESPEQLSGWIQRSSHPLAFWVMALLFNAGQETPFYAKRTRVVAVPEPSDPLWQRAWALAVWFNPALPSRLMYGADDFKELSCPLGWKMK